MAIPTEVLDFWFGQLDEHGLAAPEASARWWRKDEAFDATIRARFGADHERLLAGELEPWRAQPTGALAYVIVADQFPRNMFRGTARMYSSDDLALAASVASLDAGHAEALALHQRFFLIMPLMHSEALADQDRCVRELTALVEQTSEPARGAIAGNLGYAHQHREIIARFGRFPHRNALLGRPSTPEEVEFLTQPGSSF